MYAHFCEDHDRLPPPVFFESEKARPGFRGHTNRVRAALLIYDILHQEDSAFPLINTADLCPRDPGPVSLDPDMMDLAPVGYPDGLVAGCSTLIHLHSLRVLLLAYDPCIMSMTLTLELVVDFVIGPDSNYANPGGTVRCTHVAVYDLPWSLAGDVYSRNPGGGELTLTVYQPRDKKDCFTWYTAPSYHERPVKCVFSPDLEVDDTRSEARVICVCSETVRAFCAQAHTLPWMALTTTAAGMSAAQVTRQALFHNRRLPSVLCDLVQSYVN
ncbi:MAG: hypothetical protein JKY23_00440 [Nitrospinaceae bacterium]|nr:hypothetical protein [Nitrospinaceae bacterium]